MGWNVELDADITTAVYSSVATGSGTTIGTVTGPDPVKLVSVTLYNKSGGNTSVTLQWTKGATTVTVRSTTLAAGASECWTEEQLGYLELETGDSAKLVAGGSGSIDATVCVHKLAKHGRGDRRSGHFG